MVRCFIAIDVPAYVRDELARVQKLLRGQQYFTGTFPSPEQFHITLHFFGDIDDIETTHDVLRSIQTSPFSATLNPVGCFTPRTIRVLWCGVDSPGMHQLQHVIQRRIRSHELFHPHITLARVKQIHEKHTLLEQIKNISVAPLTWTVDAFTLKSSTFQNGKPVYANLHTYTCER